MPSPAPITRMLSLISVLLSTLPIPPALAAASGKAPADQFFLGEVVVTARTLDNQPIGGAEIRQEALRTFGKTTVDQALDLIPGTSASSTGGSRNERLVFIRGFDRFQTTLAIDGVRVFLPADNRIDFARFLTADLSEIQVSKGYVSVLDGPGGMGGAINLVTRRPAAPLEAEAVVNGLFAGDGAYNGESVSARIGTRQERFYLQASGAQARQDHWTLSRDFTPTSLEDGGQREHSDSNDYRINLKAGYTPTATDEYTLNYTRQSGEKNAPYHVSDSASTRFWSWPYWDIDSLYFLSGTRLGKSDLRTRFYVNSFNNALYSYDSAAQTTQSLPRAFRSYYEDRAYGARIELDTALADANRLRTALHYRHDRHDEWQEGFVRVPATGAPFANLPYTEPEQATVEDTYSIALEDTQQFGSALNLVTGISYDWTDLRRAEDISVFVTGSTINQQPVNYALRNADAFNGQAALNYRWTATSQMHASLSSRTRFPTLFERFSSRFGTAVPNPDIKAERATSFEIGGDTHMGNTRFETALFYSRLTDALLSVPVSFSAPINATLNQTRNVGNGHYYGLELAAHAQLASSLQIEGNYTYLQRRLDDPTNAAFRPTGVPTHKLFASAEWHASRNLQVTPSIEWDSSRWTVTSSAAITPARYYRTGTYTLVNLALNWTVSQHLDTLLGGRNLFDRNYQLVDGFPEAGRSFYLSLRGRY